MPPPQDHMRMAHGVERDGLVLEVFDQRPLQIGVGRALQAGVERLEHNLHLVRLAIARDENFREAAAAQPLRHFVGVVDQDRKSTRLNSSHVAMSYAVFCLKKKNERAAVQPFCTSLSRRACCARPLLFFFNDPAPTEIYTLSLHDALPTS